MPRYYSFMLSEGSDVTITLESSTDPYLYLRAGEAKSGTAAYENDDIAAGTDTNSRIQATLGAGTYTIEATTYGAGLEGSFTLTVSVLGVPPAPCLGRLTIRAWIPCRLTERLLMGSGAAIASPRPGTVMPATTASC